MTTAISLHLFFRLQHKEEPRKPRWNGTDWAISASRVSDNVGWLNTNNGTHQFLEHLKALHCWSGNEYQLLEYWIISDCWIWTERDLPASSRSDISVLNTNNATHQFVQYLMVLDRWTGNDWTYQLLECLIILNYWIGS